MPVESAACPHGQGSTSGHGQNPVAFGVADTAAGAKSSPPLVATEPKETLWLSSTAGPKT